MENYHKTRTVERPSVCPFSGLPPDTPEVRVRDGSKIRHPLRYALSRMEGPRGAGPREGEAGPREGEAGPQEGEAGPREAVEGRPLCRQMVLTASGGGVSKAVTCAEVVKRRVPGLHQTTRLQFCTVDEVWDPLEAGAGLDSLTVSRNVPSIWILLSRDTPDQEPGRHHGLWAHREDGGGQAGPTPGRKRKKGGARGQGPGRQSGRATEPAKGHT
ncbi:Ribonuclease P protein subunit p25-like protein [Liparis tanakae]|uniref:Ribonuclease P protein subunit p25-like protein n=1 Tax=Liparis tanakae TaxID=230148 RepID=A0A4Z2EAB9_9TELE|nr:Ribonuclease P protein subunit p25-like protein [Liparis tanakae]TNN25484.1 Ribonuclease P protein subunit p25-like protein [Liparis tanakae]